MAHIINTVCAEINKQTEWKIGCDEVIDFCTTHQIVPVDYSQQINPIIKLLLPDRLPYYRRFIVDILLFMLIDELSIIPPSVIVKIIKFNMFHIPVEYDTYTIPQKLVIHGMLNFAEPFSSQISDDPLVRQLFKSPDLWAWIRGKKLSTQYWLNSCHFTTHANILMTRVPTVIHALVLTSVQASYVLSKDKSLEQCINPILNELEIIKQSIRLSDPSTSTTISNEWNRIMQNFSSTFYKDTSLVTYRIPGYWYVSAFLSIPEIIWNYMKGKNPAFSGSSINQFNHMYNWHHYILNTEDRWTEIWKSGLCTGTTCETICGIRIYHSVLVKAVKQGLSGSEDLMFQIFDPLTDEVESTKNISDIVLDKF